MHSRVNRVSFWSLHIIALVAIIPLVSKFEFDLVSISALLAFAAVFLASIMTRKQDSSLNVKYWDTQYSTTSDRAQRFVSDFEDRGLGWFWEIGREGELTYISKSISTTLGKSQSELLGLKFASILSENRASEKKQHWMTLGFHLSSRTAFNDLPFRSSINDSRYWSISGKPIYDQLGNYQGFRGNGLDLSHLQESERVLNEQARCDPLTGLANRLEINQTLERSLKGPVNQARNCSLFLLDLDKFKPINDTMGHPAGDQVLKTASQIILNSIGDQGQVGRVGGDEFQIVVPSVTDRTELKFLANRIINNLNKLKMIDGRTVNISASIGISITQSDIEALDAVTLVRNADLALYAAKKSGGGACQFYDLAMLRHVSEQREFEEDLRQALVKGQLSLEYQPIIEISDRSLYGFEVLVCWNHPKKGHIEPEAITNLAEEMGIISQISDWALRSACAQLKLWDSKLRIAARISPAQLANGNLVATVMGALASSEVHASQVELNISKAVFLEESSKNINMFRQLRAAGVQLVFDDFGTGYSTLSYLHQMRFDKLKIDRSFVGGTGPDGRMNSAIISSIVTLAKALKMKTTADGVDTPEELEFVKRLGCSHAQGSIFGSPLSADKATALLEASGTRLSLSSFDPDREERFKTQRRVKLRHLNCWHDGIIRNLSRNGALIECRKNIAHGSLILIDFGIGRIAEATSIWSNGSHMGVRFAEPIVGLSAFKADPKTIECSEARVS